MGQPARDGELARRLPLRHLLLHLRLVRHRCLLTEGRRPLRGSGDGHRPVQHRERLCRGQHLLVPVEQAVAPRQRPLLRAC